MIDSAYEQLFSSQWGGMAMHDVTSNLSESSLRMRAAGLTVIFSEVRHDTAPGILVRRLADLLRSGTNEREMETALLLLYNHAYTAGTRSA